jgi:hypothetical protein
MDEEWCGAVKKCNKGWGRGALVSCHSVRMCGASVMVWHECFKPIVSVGTRDFAVPTSEGPRSVVLLSVVSDGTILWNSVHETRSFCRHVHTEYQ